MRESISFSAFKDQGKSNAFKAVRFANSSIRSSLFCVGDGTHWPHSMIERQRCDIGSSIFQSRNCSGMRVVPDRLFIGFTGDQGHSGTVVCMTMRRGLARCFSTKPRSPGRALDRLPGIDSSEPMHHVRLMRLAQTPCRSGGDELDMQRLHRLGPGFHLGRQ
jgi:hypothetical protein